MGSSDAKDQGLRQNLSLQTPFTQPGLPSSKNSPTIYVQVACFISLLPLTGPSGLTTFLECFHIMEYIPFWLKKKKPVVGLTVTSTGTSRPAKPRRCRKPVPGRDGPPPPIHHPGTWLCSPSSKFMRSFGHPPMTSLSCAISNCL